MRQKVIVIQERCKSFIFVWHSCCCSDGKFLRFAFDGGCCLHLVIVGNDGSQQEDSCDHKTNFKKFVPYFYSILKYKIMQDLREFQKNINYTFRLGVKTAPWQNQLKFLAFLIPLQRCTDSLSLRSLLLVLFLFQIRLLPPKEICEYG